MIAERGNPYVGLRPFEVDEGLLFFGRHDQITDVLQRLHQHRFVAVVGGSGSGKSSLLKAGVIPTLKAGYLVQDSDHWLIAMMKPGQSPLFNLAACLLEQIDPKADQAAIEALVDRISEEGAQVIMDLLDPLRATNTNFFLLVDQFEELFRFATTGQKGGAIKNEAIDFVNIILELTQQSRTPIHVVITMRSDFIGDCAQFFGLPEALNKSQYLVPRMTRVQLKMAVEGPAILQGLKIQPALTSKLLNELGRVKDVLPLLQHALMRMWDHEVATDENGELDLDDYERIGGLEKALSMHADEAMQGMSDGDLAITKGLFQALTTVDEHGRKIRRPVLLSELKALTGASEADLQRIIQRFIAGGRSFLVLSRTIDGKDKVLDISHESLIRQWETLVKWVEEEGESAANYVRLAEASRLHRTGKGDLLAGTALQNALEWRNASAPTVVWADRYGGGFEENMSYLEASLTEDRKLKAETIEERRRQRKRTIIWFVVVSTLAVAMLVSFLFTLNARSQADKERKAFCYLSEAALIAQKDPTQALGFLGLGLELRDDAYFLTQAINIFISNYFYRTRLSLGESREVRSIVVSQLGNTVAALAEDGSITVMDSLGRRVRELNPIDGAYAIALSADGSNVLVAHSDSVRLMRITGETLHSLRSHPRAMAFHPNGEEVLLADSISLAFFDLQGRPKRNLRFPNGKLCSVAFSSDGSKLLAGGDDDDAYLWDLGSTNGSNQSIKFKRDLQAGDKLVAGKVLSVAFAGDSMHFFTVSDHAQVKRWNLSDPNRTVDEFFVLNRAEAISWSPGRDRLLICDSTEDVNYILLEDGEYRDHEFLGHSDVVRSAVFSPGMKAAFSAASDGTVRCWDLDWKEEWSEEPDQAFRQYLKSDKWEPLPDSVKARCDLK
jgi:energy-coupling factor transporter ATP-binding protein EcfA2